MMPLILLDCGKSTPNTAGPVPTPPQLVSAVYQASSPMMTIVLNQTVTFTGSTDACRLDNPSTGIVQVFASLNGSGTDTLTGDINFIPGQEPIAGDVLLFNYVASQGNIANGDGLPLGEVIHFPVTNSL